MWTVDASRCPGCVHKDNCEDRKKIIQTLSPMTNELNTDPAFSDGPGDGIIIIHCQYDLPKA